MVIQRWQTLMLLISAVMMALFSFCSLGQIQGADITVNFTALSMTVEGTGKTYMPTWYILVVSLLSTLLPLIGIFRYKALKMQRKICMLSIVLTLAAMASAWIASSYAGVEGARGMDWSSIVIAPFVAIVALIAAIRCIGSDMRKLSGYDRLR